MISATKTQAVAPWLPMIFSAVLSLITLIAIVASASTPGSHSWGWAIPFLCFLPMCFLFVGAAVAQSRKEILDLRAQVAELQGQQTR